MPAPVIAAGAALLNAASFTSSFAPGGLASLFGANFSAAPCNAPFPSTTACGVSVVMNGIAAPLLYVGPGQVNLQVPWELQGQSTVLVYVLANGIRSLPITANVAAVAPAIYTLNQQGTGPAAIGRVDNTIEMYMTGLGAVTNPPATGAGAGTGSTTTATPTVSIGGLQATVTYSGLAPTWVGLYQVNVEIPSDLMGLSMPVVLPVVVTIAGVASNTVTITF